MYVLCCVQRKTKYDVYRGKHRDIDYPGQDMGQVRVGGIDKS